MRRALTAAGTLAAAAALLVLAVSNRHPVPLTLDPFGSGGDLTLPAYVLVFAAVGAGVVAGGTAVWARQRPVRRALREMRGEIGRLQRELDAARTTASARAALPPPR